MKIISISVDDETLKGLDVAGRSIGIKSRSRLLRNALFDALNEYKSLQSVKGHIECVFALSYKSSKRASVFDILHEYSSIIETELHRHGSSSCMVMIFIKSDAKRMRSLFFRLKQEPAVKSIKYILIE